jgi:hypothetical protein
MCATTAHAKAEDRRPDEVKGASSGLARSLTPQQSRLGTHLCLRVGAAKSTELRRVERLTGGSCRQSGDGKDGLHSGVILGL